VTAASPGFLHQSLNEFDRVDARSAGLAEQPLGLFWAEWHLQRYADVIPWDPAWWPFQPPEVDLLSWPWRHGNGLFSSGGRAPLYRRCVGSH
jgi:hypothetical protein